MAVDFATERRIQFFFQRLFFGFDDSTTLDLGFEFVLWMAPRIKRFAQVAGGYPHYVGSQEAWDKILSQ